MKKIIIILASMFFFAGCSDTASSVSAIDESEPVIDTTSTDPVTEPETAVTKTVKPFICSDVIDYSITEISSLVITHEFQGWSVACDIASLVVLEDIGVIAPNGQSEMARERLTKNPEYKEFIRNEVVNLYVANGIDDPVQMEKDIEIIYKVIDMMNTVTGDCVPNPDYVE